MGLAQDCGERPITRAALTIEADGRSQSSETYQAALGWAFVHVPTRQTFMRCTGEDIGSALDRYRTWAEENLAGLGAS